MTPNNKLVMYFDNAYAPKTPTTNPSTTGRIRKLDQEAYERISKKMTIVDMPAGEQAEWEKVLRESVKRLSQGTLDKALIDRVVKLAGKS